jgi:hypothetical protein
MLKLNFLLNEMATWLPSTAIVKCYSFYIVVNFFDIKQNYGKNLLQCVREGGSLTTMKSLLAPNTRISAVLSVTEDVGSDAFSFLKSKSGNFELSFISDWYLEDRCKSYVVT